MTVPQAGFLAPVQARIDKIEVALSLLEALVGRLMADVVDAAAVADTLTLELRELRAAVRGRS